MWTAILIISLVIAAFGAGAFFSAIGARVTISEARALVSSARAEVALGVGGVEKANALAEFHRARGDEWKEQAIRLSATVRDQQKEMASLALQLAGPSMPNDDEGDPPSVNEADRMAMEARRVEMGRKAERQMEPVAIAEKDIPPVMRIDGSDGESEEDEEDTSFAARMARD